MKNSLNNVSFLTPIAAIFIVAVAVAVALQYKNKPAELEPSASSITSAYNHPAVSANTAFNSPDAANYQNYDMTEPFAANVPFDSTSAAWMYTPAAWMQMMNNMMNIMQMNQMNQMMRQMAAMPMQMMNPHGFSPNYNPSPVEPMDPAEYRKWYEQQLEAMKMDKK